MVLVLVLVAAAGAGDFEDYGGSGPFFVRGLFPRARLSLRAWLWPPSQIGTPLDQYVHGSHGAVRRHIVN